MSFPLNHKGLSREIDGAFSSTVLLVYPPRARAVDTARQGLVLHSNIWLANGVDFPVPKVFKDLSGETLFSGFTDYQKDRLKGLHKPLVDAFFTFDQLWKNSLYELKKQSFPYAQDPMEARIAFLQFTERHPGFEDPVVSIFQPPKWLWRFLGQVSMIVKARPESGLNAKLSFTGSQHPIDNGSSLHLTCSTGNSSPESLWMLNSIEGGMRKFLPPSRG